MEGFCCSKKRCFLNGKLVGLNPYGLLFLFAGAMEVDGIGWLNCGVAWGAIYENCEGLLAKLLNLKGVENWAAT